MQMRIGITINGLSDDATLPGRIEAVRDAAARGFAGVWAGEPATPDPLTAFAVIGREVPGIGLGTAVVHTHTRHPLVLAGQALTVQAAIGNRLSLGISPSSRTFVERYLGSSWEKPGQRMREYLSALAPLLRGESIDYQGEMVRAVGAVNVPGASPPSLLVSALGPAMLRIAGELADGTVTAFTGPKALANYVVPTISRAAAAAGRATPRVVAIATVSVTTDPEGARAQVAAQSGFLGQLPGYRAMLDREGVAGVEGVAIVGDETTVEREVRRYAEAGATEFVASITGPPADRARTMTVLAGLAAPDTTEIGTGNDLAINARVIAEFRANGGKVGGRFEGTDLAILHTTGAQTGQERLTPLTYVKDNGHIYVFAAGPGLPHHPAWYRNLVARPDVTVEVGTETYEAAARVLTGDARSHIWAKFVSRIPELPGWQREARREFPVIELRRKR
jgi:F420-dependent oxidoreductase-like protein/deazaflavin-dependent oxidoreductase (nitroreductase family)